MCCPEGSAVSPVDVEALARVGARGPHELLKPSAASTGLDLPDRITAVA